MLRLCGRRSCGEMCKRAGDGLHVDGFRNAACGDRYPQSLNACSQRGDDHMAYRTSSGRGIGVMMPGHSKRYPQYQQEDHDRDDDTPDWLLLRHSCEALNR